VAKKITSTENKEERKIEGRNSIGEITYPNFFRVFRVLHGKKNYIQGEHGGNLN